MMLPNRAYEQYRQQGIATASPVELIVMLYDGCLKRLRLADQAMRRQEIATANEHLQRAQDILTELSACLDMRFDIAQELLKLYDYMIDQLIDINLTKDAARIEPIAQLLVSLREAWVQVKRTAPKKVPQEAYSHG